MALIKMELYSECLTRKTMVNVIVPEISDPRVLPNGKYPVVWLMHGAFDGFQGWHRFTSIELYAQKRGVMVVMPDAENSFYSNFMLGRYYDYLTEELPRMLAQYFPMSTERQDTFIGGLSMGGHGAGRIGYRNPDKFAAMGIFSSANFIDMNLPMAPGGKRFPANFIRWQVLGCEDRDMQTLRDTIHDNRYLARTASESGQPLPKIFSCCGTQDICYQDCKNDVEYLRSLPNPYDVVFFESTGVHYWDFWDEWVRVFLQWLPIRERKDEYSYTI